MASALAARRRRGDGPRDKAAGCCSRLFRGLGLALALLVVCSAAWGALHYAHANALTQADPELNRREMAEMAYWAKRLDAGQLIMKCARPTAPAPVHSIPVHAPVVAEPAEGRDRSTNNISRARGRFVGAKQA